MPSRTISRVVVPVAAVSLLLLIVGVSGAWYVQRLQRLSSDLIEQNVASIRAAEELEVYLFRIRFELNQFLIDGDSADLTQAIAMETDVHDWYSRARELAKTDEEVAALGQIQSGLDLLFTNLKRMEASPDPSMNTREVEQLVDVTLSEEILPWASTFLDISEVELEASSRENQRLADRLVLALLLLGTCGAVAGVIAGYGMARGLSRSIVQLSLPIQDVAGHLNDVVGPVQLSADPGLEDLEQVLNVVSHKVESVITQLQDRQREVLRAEQLAAIGQLAAGLAHELRNPLMCMSVIVESALSELEQTLEERDLQILNNEIARLDRLLQQFLDFARPGDAELTDVDFMDVIQQTVGLLSARAKQLNIEINVSWPREPVIIHADASQLRQLVLNLLLNAIDATPLRGRIDVRLEGDAENTRLCRLTISDEGPGLPADALDHVFEPFFSTKDGGLGMGLAICRRIVNAHGGDLIATNASEGGALVSIRFPLASHPDDPNSLSRSHRPSMVP